MEFTLPKPSKVSKKAFFVIIGIIILLLIFLGFFLGKEYLGWFEREKPVPIPESYTPSERAKTFNISGGKEDGPRFVREVIIDPFAIKTGENQYFSIWVEDTNGIERLTIELETDNEPEVTDMALVEGTQERGRWLGGRIAKDFYQGNYYLAIFRAKNKIGEEKKMNILWKYDREKSQTVFDFFFPVVYAFSECVINETGNTTLNSTCEVTGTKASAGNIDITGSDTIILIEEDSVLGAEGGDITIEDATVQMLDRSSLFFNNGSLKNNNGRILTSRDIRIVKGEIPVAICECSSGDECCSDGCMYDIDETVCWIGSWQKTCSWSSICDETAHGIITRDYKTCKNGKCTVLEEETDTAFCFRDTDGDECGSSNSYCEDCSWGDVCDEFAWGDQYVDTIVCSNGRCNRTVGRVETGRMCPCRRDTDGIECDRDTPWRTCDRDLSCGEDCGYRRSCWHYCQDIYACYQSECEWNDSRQWLGDCCTR